MTEGGRRLATLISDLLAYTRAGVIEREMTEMDASNVVQLTLSSLAEAIRESNATVTCDSLPEVYMGAAPLQQIFLNLLSSTLNMIGGDRRNRPVASIFD
jgi:light-regulated signal transduction histidine kinase (bacteriophytochrome)